MSGKLGKKKKGHLPNKRLGKFFLIRIDEFYFLSMGVSTQCQLSFISKI